jgi:putative transposase
VARKRRFFDPGFPLHVTQRGNNRGRIFKSDADRLRYLDVLVEATDKFDCAVHCYALMNNHVHLLVSPADTRAMAKAMQSLNGKYVKYFNRVHERTGALYEGRYGAEIVDTDGYLNRVYHYIELNPVKDGYCKNPEDFLWSSHRFHSLGEPDRVVTPHRAYTLLGGSPAERQARYRRWFSGV